MTDQPAPTPDTGTAAAAEPERPDFSVFLNGLDRGATNGRLSDKLAEVVAAVKQHGKGGSLTFTINIKSPKDTDMVEVTTAIKAKVPEAAPRKAHFWIGDDGQLTDEHPAQRALLRKDELTTGGAR